MSNDATLTIELQANCAACPLLDQSMNAFIRVIEAQRSLEILHTTLLTLACDPMDYQTSPAITEK